MGRLWATHSHLIMALNCLAMGKNSFQKGLLLLFLSLQLVLSSGVQLQLLPGHLPVHSLNISMRCRGEMLPREGQEVAGQEDAGAAPAPFNGRWEVRQQQELQALCCKPTQAFFVPTPITELTADLGLG